MLEQEEPARPLGGPAEEVFPQGGHPNRQVLGATELGVDVHDQGLAEVVEQGEQQPLLAAEMGVDGAGGAARRRGHGVDGHPVDPLVGEAFGGGGQQPGPCLGLALVLPIHITHPI